VESKRQASLPTLKIHRNDGMIMQGAGNRKFSNDSAKTEIKFDPLPLPSCD
jgi:hypothetical protein